MRFKTIITLLLIMVTFAFSQGCVDIYDADADRRQAKQTQQLMTESNNQIGMPNIVNFQQKKLMKSIYELCDKENLICYAYIKSDYKGELIFVGKCIGYGIPFSAQYSNPSVYKKVYAFDSTLGYECEVMPQPEPNGLFMPTSSSATWLMMVDPKTSKPRPAYFEPEIVVSPFALHVEKML
jgi:hypothetical protein